MSTIRDSLLVQGESQRVTRSAQRTSSGILKPGVTGIIARQMPEADRVIEADAGAVGAD